MIVILGVKIKPAPHYVWSLSGKEKNRIAHAANGNSAPPTNKTKHTVDPSALSQDALVKLLKKQTKEAQATAKANAKLKKEAAKQQAEIKKMRADASQLRTKQTSEMKDMQQQIKTLTNQMASRDASSQHSGVRQTIPQTRNLGGQEHRKDLIEQAVRTFNRRDYVANLHSNALWAVLRSFSVGGGSFSTPPCRLHLGGGRFLD